MHTPGPWGIIHNEQSLAVVKSEDKLLYIIVDHRRDFGVAEPDARLIAAAPELLAALKRLYPLIHESGMVGESEFELAWLQAEAAMAKAEGGSNGNLSTQTS